MNIVVLMISKGANDYNEAMIHAAGGGHMDSGYFFEFSFLTKPQNLKIPLLVKLMIDLGANNYDEAMKWAKSAEYMNIVNLLETYM